MTGKELVEEAAKRAVYADTHELSDLSTAEFIQREFAPFAELYETLRGTVAALDTLLCVECGYRIGWNGSHGDLGKGYKMDWRDCAVCRFSREALTEGVEALAEVEKLGGG